MKRPAAEDDRLLTAVEVGAVMRVSPKTVTGWRKSGCLAYEIAPDGSIRYRLSVVVAMAAGDLTAAGAR